MKRKTFLTKEFQKTDITSINQNYGETNEACIGQIKDFYGWKGSNIYNKRFSLFSCASNEI